MIPSKQVNQDPQSNLLWNISKQLERLGTIIYNRLATLVSDNQSNTASIENIETVIPTLATKTALNLHTQVDFVLQFTSATFSPADGTTYYFSSFGTINSTVNLRTLVVPINCILVGYTISTSNAGTCTQETVGVYFRLNNTTDVLLSNAVTFSNTALVTNNFYAMNLNTNLTVGDFYELKTVSPTWVTNPTSVSYSIQLYFKLR